MRSAYGRASSVKRLETFWTPRFLFSAGAAGAWYDPSDSSTVWRNSARTLPALLGDSVGAIDDKSGNGNHALQTSGTKKPILRQTTGGHWFLEGDGIDDSLIISFANTQPMERISAIRILSRTGSDKLFGGGGAGTANLFTNDDTKISINSGSTVAKLGFSLNTDFVITERHDGASSRITFNNTAYVTGNAGTGVGTGISMFSERFGGENTEARIYGVVMGSFGNLTDEEIQKTRNFMAIKAGITL